MPPIPVYTSSPINVSKPSAVTPATQRPAAAAGGSQSASKTPPVAAGVDGSQPQSQPPIAQPAARPSLPVQSGAPALQPVSTAPTTTAKAEWVSPPAAQPGAVPVPPTGATASSPSPKTVNPPAVTAPAPTSAMPMPMPPQMAFPPPAAPQPIQGRSSTTAAAPPSAHTGPLDQISPPENNLFAGHAHPVSGYQQDIHATEFTSHQRAAHDASVSNDASFMPNFDQTSEDGIWGTVKRWAFAAGQGLASVEEEVWKRINRDP